jgi:hypothetical protein
MIDAITWIIEEQREHWPLTVRQIHYRLLGPDAPLQHASKPGSRYVNDHDSYRAAIESSLRLRLGHCNIVVLRFADLSESPRISLSGSSPRNCLRPGDAGQTHPLCTAQIHRKKARAALRRPPHA